MGDLRRDATEIWTAGLDAVRAQPLVQRSVQRDGDHLVIDDQTWSRSQFDRVVLVGGGKAGTAMARGFLDAIGDWLPVIGWLNVPAGTEPASKDGTEAKLGNVTIHPARPASVNEPTDAGVEGTSEILQMVANAGPRDLCVALISGGGSALLPAPAVGITLEDKQAVTRFLSAAGADITELNTVRKHLSRIKGGGLLQACRASHLITLILSDVLGDPLDVIASGPTVNDTSTAEDALRVLGKLDPNQQLPPSVYRLLEHPPSGSTSPPESSVLSSLCVIGNNAVAVDHSGIRAEQLGYNHVMQSARECEGSAEDVGRHLADMTVQMLRPPSDAHQTDCLITGGEPIVTLAPADIRGKGGRNQQLVLAAYQRLLEHELSEDEWSRVCILSGGTDGEDGPTDAAGALIDGHIHQSAVQLGLEIGDSLKRNDAYTFFDSIGGLLMTGPTGTNVCDVRVAVVASDIVR
ncbi:MAG: DUF4147 domain-containing protein [Planctomycetota bacterium]